MSLFWNTPKSNIFYGIKDSIVDEILQGLPRETFLAGEIIMEQWDIPDGKWYILEVGEVDVWVDGKQTATLGSRDIFWEIALLNEEVRSATVVAKSDTTVIAISQEALFQMIENDDNSINKEIMRRMEENLESE